MLAEIITIGDELLMGLTVDTNSAWMGQFLTSFGFKIHQQTTISDNREDILAAINNSINRVDLVLVTGGLGPTSDDITKETIAEYFDSKLIKNEFVYSYIEEILNLRGLEMNDNNRRQAMVPDICTVLPNGKGTAPGMLFEKEGSVLISMPGVPYEMKDIMENHVAPYIKNNFNKEIIRYRLIMVYGTFEAKLAEVLEPFEDQLPSNISLAYLPTAGIIKLRLTATGNKESDLDKALDRQIELLQEAIPDSIYGYDGEMLEETVGKLLVSADATVSLAESCTGGAVSHMLSSVPGSSSYLRGSVVAYHNDIKINELNVARETIETYGAVSKETALSMAEGIRKKYNTTFAVSVTGVAGPDGGTAEKPVGTTWIAVSSKDKTIALKKSFGTKREHNVRRSSLAALDMLRRVIIETI